MRLLVSSDTISIRESDSSFSELLKDLAPSKISKKEGLLQEIAREIRYFSKFQNNFL